jgi:geranylgeranyl pyrophosphate synthase
MVTAGQALLAARPFLARQHARSTARCAIAQILNRCGAMRDALASTRPSRARKQNAITRRAHPYIVLQAYFLVADDIMDNSITRRGHACWYRVPEVGMVAINDGILLEQLIYFILRKHLKSHRAYVPLLELFLDTTHQTAHGQLLDLITAPIGTVDLNKYTLSRCAASLPHWQTLSTSSWPCTPLCET